MFTAFAWTPTSTQQAKHTSSRTNVQSTTIDTTPLRLWLVGKQVTTKMVDSYGINKCFVAKTISDNIFKRIYGKSYRTDCTVPRSDLRYLQLLHYTLDGKIQIGEMICHKDIADDLIDIFRKLFEVRYPIESMRLIDNYDAQDEQSMEHNNTSCFNYRPIAGTKRLSSHSKGKAIDLNPLYNPYVKKRTNGTLHVSPTKGLPYTNREKDFKYKIDKDDIAYKLFTSHGFRWGGNWKSLKDYQHFEKP